MPPPPARMAQAQPARRPRVEVKVFVFCAFCPGSLSARSESTSGIVSRSTIFVRGIEELLKTGKFLENWEAAGGLSGIQENPG